MPEVRMNHDEFVGRIQHRAQLPSRGAAETVIRATLETLGERLQKSAAEHLAAQLPQEIGRHVLFGTFEHLSLQKFYERVAGREGSDLPKAMFHIRIVFHTIGEAVTPGAFRKLRVQLPAEFQILFEEEAAHVG
jgi:uncharacterized protein (DUF2267 family)